MRAPGKKTVRAAARWLRSRARPRSLVLGYHRLADPGTDPFGIVLRPEIFRDHLRSVLEVARPIRLAELAQRLRAGDVPGGTVAITFDDGYAATAALLVPIVAEYEIPVTVFVPTALLGRELWWDRLERVVTAECELPAVLDVDLDGDRIVRTLDERERSADQNGRIALTTELYTALSRLGAAHRERAIDAIETWVGGPPTTPHARVVSKEEIKALSQSDLVDIGSHSVTHPFLADLSKDEQRDEIASSKSCLEGLLGSEITLFSYPNGSVTADSEALLREAGYFAACASHPDVVTRPSQRYRIPRFWPGADPDDVLRPLSRWLGS